MPGSDPGTPFIFYRSEIALAVWDINVNSISVHKYLSSSQWHRDPMTRYQLRVQTYQVLGKLFGWPTAVQITSIVKPHFVGYPSQPLI